MTKSLQFAERFHASLVQKSSRGAPDGEPLSVFTGRDPNGQARRDGKHAAVQPLDLDGDGKIDHVLLTARKGFSRSARSAVEHVRSVYGVVSHPVATTVESWWTDAEIEQSAPQTLPSPLQTATIWRSVTPLVLTRHPKLTSAGKPRLDANGRWKDGPEQQVRLELERQGFPAPLEVSKWKRHRVGGDGREIDWYRFQRTRTRCGKGRRSAAKGYGFEITFDRPVRGPVALGYGRFFGLGQFMPVGHQPTRTT